MKTISVFIIFSSIILQGQVKWDAGAGTDQWSDAANWVGNNVPATTDSVVLDNSLTSGSYTVTLPSGNTNTQVARIRITPDPGNTINFVLPSTNTSTNQALLLGDGTGNSYDFILNSGAIFKYQSGAASGTPFALVNSSDSILIYDGAKWYHNTKVGQTGIANKLAKRVAGTDHGVFEYDMPIFSSSIQFQNITYGTVKLSGASYGGLKRYITTGSSVTTIRGDFIIDANCYDSTVQTNRINIAGNLECNGYFKYAPVATPRWYTFNGKSEQTISGTGSIDLLGGMTVSSGSTLKVLNNFSLSNFNGNGTGKGVTIDGTLDLGSNVISGPCTLTVSSTGKLKLGLAPGLTSTPSSSNIQVTGTRTFNNTQWEFNGSTAQVTGDAFPASVDTLIINNSSGVTLSSALTINKGLQLNSGLLKPDYKTLSFGTLASVSGSPSSNSFISIDSSETIRKLFASTGSFTFPVGDNFGTSEYSPVTINFTSATFDPGAYVDVKLYNFKHPLNPSTTDYLSRYWRVSSSGISSFSCNASFTYNAADINGTEGNLNWGSLSGSLWNPLTGSLSGKQYTAILTGFSDFTAGEASYFSGATFMNLSLL
ncbi:MAG: hypothetical protein HYV28_17855, partial [Ignavibacteriales bacterium]|nr:hypothetical protein [Ignavibacteriales bacterium]